MRKPGLIVVVASILVLASCGGTTRTTTTTSGTSAGTWAATLISTNGTQALAFTFTMMQTSNGALSAGSVTLQQGNACFPATNGMTMTGAASGQIVSGQGGQQLNMTFTANNNVLTMTGTINPDGKSAVGSYILTSNNTGCVSDTGSWSMVRQ